MYFFDKTGREDGISNGVNLAGEPPRASRRQFGVLRSDRHVRKRGVVGGLGRRDVAYRFEQAAVVKPVHPLQRGELDGLEETPRTAPMDHLGFEQAVDRLGKRVVVGIAAAADGRLTEAGVGEPLRIAQRKVLPGLNRSSQHQPGLIVAPAPGRPARNSHERSAKPASRQCAGQTRRSQRPRRRTRTTSRHR